MEPVLLVSVDPGLNHTAIAAWEQSKLIHATLVKNPSSRDKNTQRPEIWNGMASAVAREIGGVIERNVTGSIEVVVEIPKVRQRGSGKGDPNDLIDLAGVVGSIVVALKHTRGCWVSWAPLPEEWKGQLPKEITRTRVEEKLSPEERKAIVQHTPGLMHNVYDAIHLGLVHLRR